MDVLTLPLNPQKRRHNTLQLLLSTCRPSVYPHGHDKMKTITEGTWAVKKIQLILFTDSPIMEKMQFFSKYSAIMRIHKAYNVEITN